MDRLTTRFSNGTAGLMIKPSRRIAYAKAINRLAAYEDTGLEPEEVQEIAWRAEAVAAMNDHLMSQPNRYEQAESEGRLIVLPSDPYEMADVAQEILSRACRLQREAEAALGGEML